MIRMFFTRIFNFIGLLGPGLLYAGAAVGVSHLVQSTRAGASYGFDLLWIILVVNIVKYPFFEIAPRYVMATGQNLLVGYRMLGKYAVIIFLLLTLLTMFPVLAAVSLVTSGIIGYVFNLGTDHKFVYTAMMLILMAFVLLGHYRTLDRVVKWIIIVLSLSTLVAVIISACSGSGSLREISGHFVWMKRADLLFLIALIGWMPAPIDLSVWNSMWSEAKLRQPGSKRDMRVALLDFRTGYWTTTVLAVFFLILGALVMRGSGEQLSPDGVTFSGQLISLYTASLGKWAFPLIALAALTTMLSTTITVMDAYPRLLRPMTEMLLPALKDENERQNYLNRIWMFILIAGTLSLVAYLEQTMRFMVDLATTLSFITAPLLAYLNFRVINSAVVPAGSRQPQWLRIFSVAGIFFLSLFALIFIVWRFII